jgi:hypothetical protein
MAGLDDVLSGNRAAVDEFVGALERASEGWTRRPPDAWSPSQLAEQGTRVFEEAGNVVAGTPTDASMLPQFFLAAVRGGFFRTVLNHKAFPKLTPNEAPDSATGLKSAAEARTRLEAALARFDQECRAAEAAGRQVISKYGTVSVEDYARFQEYQTRGYCRELNAILDVDARRTAETEILKPVTREEALRRRNSHGG